MSNKIILCVFFVFSFAFVNAQRSTNMYQQEYYRIDSMLVEKIPLKFKEAVYLTENAYLDGKLDYNEKIKAQTLDNNYSI